MTTVTSAPAFAAGLFPRAAIPPLHAQGLDLGTHEVGIYLLGATHIRDHVKPLGVTVYKAGATGCRDGEQRAIDCRRKRYASILKDPDDPNDPGHELTNGHEWFLVPLSESLLDGNGNEDIDKEPLQQPALLPEGIAIRNGVIRLTVPTSITVERVDRALHDLLKPRCFNAWLASPEGQKHLAQAGYDPAQRLFTRYTLMTPYPRLSLATELYTIRPRRELAAFVMAINEMASRLRAEAIVAVASTTRRSAPG